jgi:hypothetical protein
MFVSLEIQQAITDQITTVGFEGVSFLASSPVFSTAGVDNIIDEGINQAYRQVSEGREWQRGKSQSKAR